MTAPAIAERLGVTKDIVTTALHDQRIPVRPPGPSHQRHMELLDALYHDPDVVAVLELAVLGVHTGTIFASGGFFALGLRRLMAPAKNGPRMADLAWCDRYGGVR